jgi:hypothetical protein
VSDRNLTVARLVTEHIDGIEVEGDAFGDLLDSLGIAPKVERRAIVRSEKAGDPDTRAYIVSVHVVPSTDGTTQIHACTCGAFRFHELQPHVEDIRNDPEAGFESVGRCKHTDAVAIEDRTVKDREDGQQSFGAFSESDAQEDD